MLRKCPLKQGAKGQGRGAWARFIHGQEEAVLEVGLAKKAKELPMLQSGTQLSIMIPELLALILWERSTSKPESYELKCWLIELIIVHSSEFSHNEIFTHESLLLGKEPLMMKQRFMSQTQSSSLWPENLHWSAFCPLKPLVDSAPGSWKLKQAQLKEGLWWHWE